MDTSYWPNKKNAQYFVKVFDSTQNSSYELKLNELRNMANAIDVERFYGFKVDEKTKKVEFFIKKMEQFPLSEYETLEFVLILCVHS